jgi:hypothetical protein
MFECRRRTHPASAAEDTVRKTDAFIALSVVAALTERKSLAHQRILYKLIVENKID